MEALTIIRNAWLEAARTFVGDNQDFVHMNVSPGVRSGVLGMHCILYANENTMWPDIAMSGTYVYQNAAILAAQKIVRAAQAVINRNPGVYGWMPNELVALASTDNIVLQAAGVRTMGPYTVPAANYSRVSNAASNALITNMNEAQLKQLFATFDPWSRVLANFGFYNPDGVYTQQGFMRPPRHWLNLMVVPNKPLAGMQPHELRAVVECSQPGWNFVAGDKPEEFIPSIREVLSLLEEHGH